jgi:glycosyltransferase involved in cell wall biosynthesis
VLVSIIIPAHNAKATLAECLGACLDQTYPDTEVIVVDDGSTDDTAAIADTFPVQCIQQAQAGPAAARNRGVADAKGDIVVLVDSDCVPETDWIERLIEGFEDGVAAVGGVYTNARKDNALARMVHEEIAARHDTFGDEVDFLGSFNVAYRKEAFDAVGGFDESFTAASGEDNDLAYRLADQGGRLRFARTARVAHYHPTRLWPYLRTQARHGFWRVKLYVKHPKRASGDRYAGLFDLLAPPWALAVLGAMVLWLGALPVRNALPWPWMCDVLAAAVLLPYCALRCILPLRLWKRSGNPRMLEFVLVAALRDGARAVGMVRGFWHFKLRGKETA